MLTALVLPLLSCADNRPNARPVAVDDGGLANPETYLDPLETLHRMPGSTFVEILEVRADEQDRVFFCSGVKGLNVVDASDPGDMRREFQLVSSAGSAQYPRCQHIALADNRVYYSNKGDEVQPTPFVSAWDLSTAPPSEIASWSDANTTVEGIAAQGDFLYAAAHESGLKILQLTGNTLQLVGTADGLNNAWHVAVRGNYAYVADGTSLATVDISNPAAPAVVGRVTLAGTAQSVELHATADLAYVAIGQAGFAIVDLATASDPTLLSVADTGGTALQVAVDGDFAAVADWNDVRVYDVSDPSAPVLRATERIANGDAFPRVLGVAARNNYVYAGEWTGFYSLLFHSDRLAPDLFTSEGAIEFGNVAPGDQDAVAVIIGNQGTKPLVAWQVEASGPFLLDHDQAVIQPGELEVFELLFEPTISSQEVGVLTIWSDDPDDQPMTATITGNRPGFGVGDPSPDVGAQLLEGGNWQLSEHRGQVVLLAYFATF